MDRYAIGYGPDKISAAIYNFAGATVRVERTVIPYTCTANAPYRGLTDSVSSTAQHFSLSHLID